MKSNLIKLWGTVKSYSILLILGSILAIAMANLTPNLYKTIIHLPYFEFSVNEILMTLFFSVAGKEVWEAIALKNGSLRGKQALGTVLATIGGIVGPIVVFLFVAALTGSFNELAKGWAIPTATDIAFAYLVSVMIFGRSHPAVSFLLALAILDDALGLIILAIFYPSGDIKLAWLVLALGVALFAYIFINKVPREKGIKSVVNLGIWPYVVCMVISWFCFHEAGIHPVLSAIPILMAMPHSETDLGLFSQEEKNKHDLLNIFEHKLDNVIPVVLGLFGFVNAGVIFGQLNEATWAVTFALIFGKPLGITIFGVLAAKWVGLPKEMKVKDLPVLGAVAGIGFTVSLFVSLQAFPAGEIQEGAKMGALLSFFSILVAFGLAKVLNVGKKWFIFKAKKIALLFARQFYFVYLK